MPLADSRRGDPGQQQGGVEVVGFGRERPLQRRRAVL
jgi:hypothetical protein